MGTNVSSVCGRESDVCEEFRKRRVNVCCVQGARWSGHGARLIGVNGGKYKGWWTGNYKETGSVGVLVKGEICEKVMEVSRKSDRVMTASLVFGEELVRVICGYSPQSRRGPDPLRKRGSLIKL